MSDTQQGPGWWLASDGKWYPPQTPTPPPPPSPSSAGFPTPSPSTPSSSAPPPTPTPAAQGTWAGQTPPPPQPIYNAAAPAFRPPPKTNGFAVASLVLSLLWCFAATSLLGLIFGIVALVSIKKNPNQGGKGMAIAGTIIGALGIIATAVAVFAVKTGVEGAADSFGSAKERKDVTITSCTGEIGTPTAGVKVTNNSSKRSNYTITIDFTRNGTTVTNATPVRLALEPGESATREITASVPLDGSGKLDCRLGTYDRSVFDITVTTGT